ncbi:hypothetical protein NQ176_g2333 [Zarea fungicola]|uniref:Uncharacterized protein n=1 Tax=Zarea fungicola TaxID=93591 RepID=A0ACC1NPV2_9HYPO|nr:hypothetical protein NQ176_g2333 [Lecanicillium fungicola]
MLFSSLLFFLPLLAHADVSLPEVSLPENALPGFALHLMDESGNVTYVHESEFDSYGVSMSVDDTYVNGTDTIPVTRRGLPSGDSITCESQKTFNTQDLHHGMIKLMEYLSCGYTIKTSPVSKYLYVASSHYEGSSVIYVCNYSGQYRTIKGPQLVDFLGQVFNHCGQRNIAGWYSEHFYDMAWGYTNNKNGFCGPPQ